VTRPKPDPPADQERLLARRDLLALGGLVAAELLVGGCKKEEPLRPGEYAVELAALADGQRLIVFVEGNPVELLKSAGSVHARSLRCTHWGCVVRWKEEQRQYVCPCHDGRYDENGAVIAGPPSFPLRDLPVRIAGGSAVVGPAPQIQPARGDRPK
jgi:Rieske Fe-S protein